MIASRRRLWSNASTTTTEVSAQFWNFFQHTFSTACFCFSLSATKLFLIVVNEQFESKTAQLAVVSVSSRVNLQVNLELYPINSRMRSHDRQAMQLEDL